MTSLDPNIKRLAAIAYGEASTLNDPDEISGIAFAVANRARAWGKKTVADLIQADPNYTYAINGKNRRYERFMKAGSTDEIDQDLGMKQALNAATKAWANDGSDPSNGAYWWDGVDFKTNYKNHPKVKDGFKFSDPAHNIFGVEENTFERILYWKVRNRKTGEEVNSKERGRFKAVWLSTAAHGKTIFWLHDPDYLITSGGKAYR
ncbi:hypothetical protein [Massilia orientalis]|uniref:Uncharacterized protein n=1 Tax=Massilia orientalis TaxID=3050128 RepID=A0ACC7MC27_9BURK|nr:hypothetical protein [Massilia sp. YIM B02787]